MPATEARTTRRARTVALQALVGLLGAALCLVMVFLGLWQMQVFESQKGSKAQEVAQQPAVPLESNLTSSGSSMPLYGHQVSVTGTFLPTHQVLVGTKSPWRVVTALRTTGGRTVAVVRGTTTSSVAPTPPSGTQTVSGVILPKETSDGTPVAAGAPTGVQAVVRLDQLAQGWPAPLVDGYVTMGESQQRAEGLGTIAAVIPDTDGGRVRNQGYALQWWAFAAFGAVVTVIAVRAVGRREDGLTTL